MPDPKIAITINQDALDTLDEAAQAWPELAGNRSALIRKVLADWRHNREQNSKRGALKRIEENLNTVLDILRSDHW